MKCAKNIAYLQKQPPEVLYKKSVLKSFEIFTGNFLRNISSADGIFEFLELKKK